MNEDLKWIKKHYSEKMMHLCRKYFSSILETKGLLPRILSENFYNHSKLAEDIINDNCEESFKNFIFSKVDINNERIEVDKNPYELMKEAGYTLYKCESIEDTNKFKKYYDDGELLCSFNDMDYRIRRCDIFFAVKDNADEIERSLKPRRQDEYGTSVISLQFNKGIYNDLSIKNRYNHTVNNPDATYSNNLDNIIEGLTSSFEKEFKYNMNNNLSSNFQLENYTFGVDNRYYKFNVELGGNYYCPNNICIEDSVYQYEQEKYILIENYLLDLVNKTLTNIDPTEISKDISFEKAFTNIENILVEKQNQNKKITITDIKGRVNTILINSDNEILELDLPNLKYLGDNFLRYNHKLSKMNVPNVTTVGRYVLFQNKALEQLDLPNVKSIHHRLLCGNNLINKVNLPLVEHIGNHFLYGNNILTELDLPNIKTIGGHFLYGNDVIKNINIQNVEEIGNSFLELNNSLEQIYLPKVKFIDFGFLFNNNKLTDINLESVEMIESRFLFSNTVLRKLDMPNIKSLGDRSLYDNKYLRRYVNKITKNKGYKSFRFR